MKQLSILDRWMLVIMGAEILASINMIKVHWAYGFGATFIMAGVLFIIYE